VAQHHMVHQPLLVEANRRRFNPGKGLAAITPTKPEGGWKSQEERQRVRREVWANALGWSQLGKDVVLGRKEDNIVVSLHFWTPSASSFEECDDACV
jgi:protein farnesyltransferase subunit beta